MNPAALLLYPLACLYRAISGVRNMLYDKQLLESCKVALPVVSVGNISAGGNGKTPLCIYLTQKLKERGFKPVVLMRGYGGKLGGPILVKADHTPGQVGDEAVLMHKLYGLEVVVARHKVAGAKFIEEHKLGNLIILDDGLQHRKLARNIDIITINIGTEQAVQDLVRGELLPLGRFREARDKALQRADIVVLAYRRPLRSQQEVDSRVIRVLPPNKKACRSFLKTKGVFSLSAGRELKGGRIAAFCALANPQSFFESLKDLGFELAGTKAFNDHHQFTSHDLDVLQQEFPDVPLVCSEKDSVKLNAFTSTNIWNLKTELEVVPSDAFLVQVLRGINTPAQAQAS